MSWHYLIREFFKNKWINLAVIISLIIGFTFSLFIGKYLLYEYSFDKFFENSNEIFRITHKKYNEHELIYHSAKSFPGLSKQLSTEIPEIRKSVRFYYWQGDFSYKENILYKQNLIFSNSSIFDMFSIPLKMGRINDLDDINNVFISETAKRKIFGEGDVIDKTIYYGNRPLLIKGVFKDIPANSHMVFDFIISYKSFIDDAGDYAENSWKAGLVYTYILVENNSNSNSNTVERKINSLYQQHVKDSSDQKTEIILQKLKDIHISSDLKFEIQRNNNKTNLNILASILSLVLVSIGLIFFFFYIYTINIRQKVLNIRLVLGLNKIRLLLMLCYEVAIKLLVPFFIAICLFFILGSRMSQWFQLTDIFNNNIFELIVYSLLVILVLISILVSYIIFKVFFWDISLKENRTVEMYKNYQKNLLIAFQLVIIFGSLLTSSVFYKQLNYILHSDLGYKRENRIVLKAPAMDRDSLYLSKYNMFKESLLRMPFVNNVTSSLFIPGNENTLDCSIRKINSEQIIKGVFSSYYVDYDFIKTYGIQLLSGREFVKGNLNDKNAVVIDETVAKQIGYTHIKDALDQYLIFNGTQMKIIGVVKSFRQESYKTEYKPTVFFLIEGMNGLYTIYVNSFDEYKFGAVKREWEKFFLTPTMNYFYLSDIFNSQYNDEFVIGKFLLIYLLVIFIISTASIITISNNEAKNKLKNVCIKKILGANFLNIGLYLFKDNIKIIISVFIIVSLLSIRFMNSWLDNFTLKISLNLSIFFIPIFIVLIVNLLIFFIYIKKVNTCSISQIIKDTD